MTVGMPHTMDESTEDSQPGDERMPPIAWLDVDTPFPPPEAALGPDTGLEGLLAIGGDLSVDRLEAAYRQGAFPWFTQGQPVLWWSPDPRMVLQVSQFKLTRSLRKTLQRFLATPGCEVRVDSAFDAVVEACSAIYREGQVGTWITDDVRAAYGEWHRKGRAHSFETWIDGELVGGLYGVNLGRMFFGESMFSRRTDASKMALAALVAACKARGIDWIDCQQNTRHLSSLGAGEVSRAAFQSHLAVTVPAPSPPDWTYDLQDWINLGVAIPR